MAQVRFKTRSGTVSFTTLGRKKKGTRKPNAYALFVKRHIGKHLAKGLSATAAMRAVAREYRGR